ncbi:carbohydrate ABC transporter membrane protein 2, CUT1 family [Nocardioides terrae]|uniref:Carbohydrate ABC transporter membrane protein 2, CUT1 family n=1 Tax=Nocardioides terrae TaxID=574651 RepID=A0A1I1N2Q3_9ACTN|nr:carbohydrate ABC transporter permease [Nocardioides terrae]SFC88070.1 carbohydrate ABC transporter membrane protein 2, CUT1 family [Nocardioides terrae]
MTVIDAPLEKLEAASETSRNELSNRWASMGALIIAVLWTVPTAGLLVTSFRPEDDINSSGWWNVITHPSFTFDNYKAVLGGSQYSLTDFFVNSFVITIPAVIIPISIATMAAYAFAWMSFPLKNTLFILIFALQIVPIQVTMIPLLKLYVDLGLAGNDAPGGGFYTIWLSHSVFALPLAIYLLHNFMMEIPGELVESARVDGAGHVQIFMRLIVPLMVPAIAAFAILQFLWVWNDLLVALVFGGGSLDISPLTVALANLSGTRGADWYLLSAGAFVSLVVPLAVFLGLQRFFVRGLLAGSVKG